MNSSKSTNAESWEQWHVKNPQAMNERWQSWRNSRQYGRPPTLALACWPLLCQNGSHGLGSFPPWASAAGDMAGAKNLSPSTFYTRRLMHNGRRGRYEFVRNWVAQSNQMKELLYWHSIQSWKKRKPAVKCCYAIFDIATKVISRSSDAR